MNRNIVLTAVLTVITLIGMGCNKEQVKVVMTPVTVTEPQQIEPEKTVEQIEPNLPQMMPEPPQKPAEIVQGAPIEPNMQEPKVSPAEINEPKPQTASPKLTPEQELCNRCTEILGTYVDSRGMIDYGTLSRKKLELLNVLDLFRNFSRYRYNAMSKEDKLAFWINAYNLEFIKIVADNYPIKSSRVLRLFWPPNSIQHIKGLRDQHKFIIMNEEFTLQEINEQVLQKEFDDPRLYFAIYYGTVSEPPLQDKAYCGQDLSKQLDEQVKKFLANGHCFRIERENQSVYLSAIFKDSWQGELFIAKYGTDLKFKDQTPAIRAVLNFLTNYLSPEDINFLETGNYTVKFMRYDWTLNDSAD